MKFFVIAYNYEMKYLYTREFNTREEAYSFKVEELINNPTFNYFVVVS